HTMRGFVELLQARHEAELDAEARELIRHALGGTRRMQQLIDDLLEYARAGSAERRTEELPLGAAVDDSSRSWGAGSAVVCRRRGRRRPAALAVGHDVEATAALLGRDAELIRVIHERRKAYGPMVPLALRAASTARALSDRRRYLRRRSSRCPRCAGVRPAPR